jgi:sugar porter (SP) family MFS transporter
MATPAPRAAVVPDAGYVILIAAAAAMGGFLFGFDTAVINGAVLALKSEFDASSLGIGLAVSLALLGSAVGAFVAGPLADRIGRTRCMILASIMFAASAVGSGLPIGLYDFIAWRVLGGIAVGAASVIAPAYIAECSPAEMRGRLGSLQQLAIVVGIFIALLSNYAIAAVAGSAAAPFWFGLEAWRWMFWSEVPAALIYGVFAFVIPESPRYLVAQGRDDDAHEVLLRIVGDRASHRVAEIRRTVSSERKPKLSDLRGDRFGLLPIVWVGMILSMFQQFVGINVIFYYSNVLWQIVGFTEQNALLITMITGLTNIVTTLVAIAFIDRFGRKPLLLAGSIGMVVTLGTMAWIFGTSPVNAEGFPVLGSTPGYIALIAANVYVFCFGFSWGPVTWVLLGEMFNNRIRGSALALGAGVQWIANFAVSTTFPPIAYNLGVGAAYGLYTIFAALSFVFVASAIRETKGKELEDMA